MDSVWGYCFQFEDWKNKNWMSEINDSLLGRGFFKSTGGRWLCRVMGTIMMSYGKDGSISNSNSSNAKEWKVNFERLIE